jgi:predicted RecA/RadA family phage recombinase
MGRTFQHPGEVVTHENTSGADIAVDDVVVMGDTVGVALADIPDQGEGSVSITGVHELAKADAEAFTQGETLHWNATDEEFTTTAIPSGEEGVENAGVAAADAAAADAVALVKLTPGTGSFENPA